MSAIESAHSEGVERCADVASVACPICQTSCLLRQTDSSEQCFVMCPMCRDSEAAFTFVVNFMVPGPPFRNLVMSWSTDTPPLGWAQPASTVSGVQAWRRRLNLLRGVSLLQQREAPCRPCIDIIALDSLPARFQS
jgi:hypothetical protein